MIEQKQFPDLLGMVGLRPKKRTPESYKYASFHRRMFAVALDFTIAAILLAPIIDYALDAYQGPPLVNMEELKRELEAAPDDQERSRIYWQTMIESGAIKRRAHNVAIHFGVIMVFMGICWHFWAATPGKMVMRIKIVDASTEQPISDLQIMLRLCGYILSAMFLLIGFFWIGFDKRRQGWHDKLADTVVITLPWFKNFRPGTQAAGLSDSREPAKEE